MITIHVLNGPNPNLLGRRATQIDGGTTLADIERLAHGTAGALGAERARHDEPSKH